MRKVLIFEYQDLRYASRARKEAFSLSVAGYDVTLLGFNRQIKHKKQYSHLGVNFCEFPLWKNNKRSFLQKVINIINI